MLDEFKQGKPDLIIRQWRMTKHDKKDNELRVPRRVVEKKKKKKKGGKGKKKWERVLNCMCVCREIPENSNYRRYIYNNKGKSYGLSDVVCMCVYVLFAVQL